MVKRILIIDDDIELTMLLKRCVKNIEIEADIAHTGVEGLNLFDMKSNNYQLIVLDVMLPDINGLSLLSQIRETSGIPILMLTARTDEGDKVAGLKGGADDYLTKPFGINEFLARVESLIRRYTILNHGKTEEDDILKFKNLIIDNKNRIVKVNEEEITLTAKEFELLYFLASNKGRIFTKNQLYTSVWKDEYAFDDNNIMSFISKLRKKIQLSSDLPCYIETVRGVGYRFNKEV